MDRKDFLWPQGLVSGARPAVSATLAGEVLSGNPSSWETVWPSVETAPRLGGGRPRPSAAASGFSHGLKVLEEIQR